MAALDRISPTLERSSPSSISYEIVGAREDVKELKAIKIPSMTGSSSMPRRKLGFQGLEVSAVGLGCRSLSSRYEKYVEEKDALEVLKFAFENGVTFFDTSDFYGVNHSNEELLSVALKKIPLPREKVQLASKFGILKMDGQNRIIGTPEYVRKACEASLARLGVDYIDLYYQHRVDSTVPIEVTIGEMKKLVEEGKVKYIGLSDASAETIRRAHAVHPITAVQMEWSLWTRGIEDDIVPLCKELGIGIVCYSPLGRGFFAGKAIEVKDYRPAMFPQFEADNLEKNKVFFDRLLLLGKKHNCTPGQLTLAWLLHRGNEVVPIPGTTKIANMKENMGGVFIKLTLEEMDEISAAVPHHEVAGLAKDSFGDTPPLATYLSNM